MRNKKDAPNIDLSDLANYPDGRIKDDTGTGDGTGVDEFIYGDIQEFFYKLMRLASIVPNSNADNESNGYQTIDALKDFVEKRNVVPKIVLMVNSDGTIKKQINTIPFTLTKTSTGNYEIAHSLGNNWIAMSTNMQQGRFSHVSDFNDGITRVFVRDVNANNVDSAFSVEIFAV